MISFKDIHLTFKKKLVFKAKNFDIAKGEKILISGTSGSGKTTLFKMLLGFEKPDRGKILFNNLPMNKENIQKIRQDIFYLSQDIDLRNEKVINILTEVFEYNRNQAIDTEKLDSLLQLLSLDNEILDQKVNDLSGGERQRIGLVLCFLLDRPVWLLDEPTSALEETMKEKIVQYILQQDKTILIVSHDDVWTRDKVVRIERWI